MASILEYNFDLIFYALLITAGVLWLKRRIRRAFRRNPFHGLPFPTSLVMALLSIPGAFYAGIWTMRSMQSQIGALAPHYAWDMAENGHDSITLDTSPDDPTYLKLIELQKNWLRLNPEIADVYTMVRDGEGQLYLLVDSETDYNRDGRYEGAREMRTAIGEPYSNPILNATILSAFAGKPGFCDDSYRDKWGMWVSSAYPIRNANGEVTAVLGIDYPSDAWLMTILTVRCVILTGGLIVFLMGASTSYLISRVRFETSARHRVEEQLQETILTRERERVTTLAAEVEARTIELKRAAMTDKLTGLPNRTMFFERLQKAIQQTTHSVRTGTPRNYAVLFIDFDRFKIINDSLGHSAGDQLLVMVGERLRAALTPFDNRSVAARLGGDEFAVLVERLRDSEEASEIAQRLLDVFAAPYILEGREVSSSASVGITLSDMGYQRAEDVLRDADAAMYRSKAGGRARYTLFDPMMYEDAVKRLALENDLRGALQRDEFTLHFQPIVSMAEGDIVGAECLLRWRHPTRGLISPGEFIPLAEESGLIVDIGMWAIEQACLHLNRWDGTRGHRMGYLSVNLSPRQMLEESFITELDRVIRRTGVERKRLVIEMTESALMRDAAAAERTLTGIRGLGAKVYMDDFGAGMSSLGSIRQFPLDGIKLDRSFLDDSVTSRRAAAVLHCAATLARDLEIEVVAEGVECLEQVALLQAMGFERAQGYLFSRPLGADNLEEMVTNSMARMAA